MTQTQTQETGLTMIVTIVDIITSAKKINKGALVYLLHTHVGQKIKSKDMVQWGRGCVEMRKWGGG